MRILLVGNYEPDAQQSMLRYADWLERMLKTRGYHVEIARPRPYFSRLSRHPGLAKYLGYIDKFLLFPPRLRRLARAFALVHVVDHSNSMYLSAAGATPSLITCHDVLAIRAARGEFPSESTGWSGRLLQRWILAGLRGARHVICDSAKTASDLKALTGERGAQVRVIPLELNWSYQPGPEFPASLTARWGLNPGEPYLLHVGGNQWYKNRLGALRTFSRLIRIDGYSTLRFVLAGKPWTAAMRSFVREEGLGDRAIEAVAATNEELQALYSHAQALLFPSLEEGFGWPILEAQACGCPVITTNRPPMSEVAGQAAIFIDPADLDRTEAAAAAIAAGLQHRESLRQAGFANLKRFDGATIADQYCAVYEAILKARPTQP
jgi:glycosyltransferase involved in cell wall biosynthesis